MKNLGSFLLLVAGLLVCMYGAIGLIGGPDFLSALSIAIGFGSLVVSFLLLFASNRLFCSGLYAFFPLAFPLVGWLIAVSISFTAGASIALIGTLVAVVCVLVNWIVVFLISLKKTA